jgi:uncharacterized membrane protein
MRGLVMVLMVIDHASMAFDGHHVAKDSALYPDAMTHALPTAEFLTRWVTHLCAPTFVFLAGTALALSVEKKVVRGISAWEIDKGILIRGAIIALLDPTIISLGSGRCRRWRSGGSSSASWGRAWSGIPRATRRCSRRSRLRPTAATR